MWCGGRHPSADDPARWQRNAACCCRSSRRTFSSWSTPVAICTCAVARVVPGSASPTSLTTDVWAPPAAEDPCHWPRSPAYSTSLAGTSTSTISHRWPEVECVTWPKSPAPRSSSLLTVTLTLTRDAQVIMLNACSDVDFPSVNLLKRELVS